MFESKLNPDLSDMAKVFEVDDILILWQISAGYFE
jgi:hypothetical protein